MRSKRDASRIIEILFFGCRTSEQTAESTPLSDAELLSKSMTGFSEVIW